MLICCEVVVVERRREGDDLYGSTSPTPVIDHWSGWIKASKRASKMTFTHMGFNLLVRATLIYQLTIISWWNEIQNSVKNLLCVCERWGFPI